jgi:hypothetical protein
VVIRLEPSKSVCTLLRDRGRGEFKLGQWLRGRIYERRCDLSPDGKHFFFSACQFIGALVVDRRVELPVNSQRIICTQLAARTTMPR